MPIVALSVVLSPVVMLALIGIMSDPVALSCLVVVVGAVVLRPPYGPDLSYLDRAPPARVVVGRVLPRSFPVRFLPPVDDVAPPHDIARVTTPDDVRAEIDRLLACYQRAVASRHKTRAATYAARIGRLQSSVSA